MKKDTKMNISIAFLIILVTPTHLATVSKQKWPVRSEATVNGFHVSVNTAPDPNDPLWTRPRSRRQTLEDFATDPLAIGSEVEPFLANLDDSSFVSSAGSLPAELYDLDSLLMPSSEDDFQKTSGLPDAKLVDDKEDVKLMIDMLKDGGMLRFGGLQGKGWTLLEIKTTIIKPTTWTSPKN